MTTRTSPITIATILALHAQGCGYDAPTENDLDDAANASMSMCCVPYRERIDLPRIHENAEMIPAPCVPLDPSGTLHATPAKVPVPRTGAELGTTTICWTTTCTDNGEIWLATDDGGEKLFARGPSGCQEAPWIRAGASYEFRLYASTDHVMRIGKVIVTGVAGESRCDCPRGSSCHCGENWCWPSDRPCP